MIPSEKLASGQERRGVDKRSGRALCPHPYLRAGTSPLPMTRLSFESARPQAGHFLSSGLCIRNMNAATRNSD